MWAKQLKDKKIRFKFNKKEFKNLSFTFLMNNCLLDSPYKLFLTKRFLSKNKNHFKTQARNRCSISFRSRSTLRDFRLSRIVFRTFASSGLLLGVKKSSW